MNRMLAKFSHEREPLRIDRQTVCVRLNMKTKITLAVGLGAMLIATAFAQTATPPSGAQGSGDQMSELATKLNNPHRFSGRSRKRWTEVGSSRQWSG